MGKSLSLVGKTALAFLTLISCLCICISFFGGYWKGIGIGVGCLVLFAFLEYLIRVRDLKIAFFALAKVLGTLSLAAIATFIVELGAIALLFEAMSHGKELPQDDLGVGFAVIPLALGILTLVFPLFLFLGWHFIERVVTAISSKFKNMSPSADQIQEQ